MAIGTASRRKKARLTAEEFLRLLDDGRKYELVDGEAKEVPAGHRHDVIGAHVIVRLAPYARGRGYLASSQAGFCMLTGNIRSPDVAFTRKQRLPEEKPSEGFEAFAPDLAIEIVSPHEDRADLLRKIGEYFASGAQQVWLLFPETQTVKVYTDPFEMRTLTAEDEIDGGDLLPSFRCKVRELFEIE